MLGQDEATGIAVNASTILDALIASIGAGLFWLMLKVSRKAGRDDERLDNLEKLTAENRRATEEQGRKVDRLGGKIDILALRVGERRRER